MKKQTSRKKTISKKEEVKFLKYSQYYFPAGLFLLSLLLRLILIDQIHTYRVIEADGAGYVLDARAFLETFELSKISIHNHPAFILLIAFFSWLTPDWEMAGRLASIVSGSFIGPLLFLISQAKGNNIRVSFFAGVITSILPLYVNTSYQVFNDTLNCTFLLFSILYLILAFRDEKRIFFFLSGLGFSLAYLTRPDSFVPFFFAFLFVAVRLIISGLNKRKAGLIIIFTSGFALLAIPYVIYLHGELGTWVLSGRQGLATKALSSFTGGNYEEDYYGLTEDLSLKSTVTKKSAASDEEKKGGFINSWLEHPGKMTSNLVKNFKLERDLFLKYVPWYIILFAFTSLFFGRRYFFSSNIPFFVFITPILFLYPFFWTDPRHIFHYFLPLWLWAGEGVELSFNEICKLSMVRNISHSDKIKNYPKYLVYLVIILVAVSSFERSKAPRGRQIQYLSNKKIGKWISQNTDKDSVVMSRWSRAIFYSERKGVIFPYASWRDIKRYMKKNKVTYIVVGEEFLIMRPQVKKLLAPLFTSSPVSPDKSLSIAHIKRDRPAAIIYKVENY